MTRRAWCVLLLAALLACHTTAWNYTFHYNATWVCIDIIIIFSSFLFVFTRTSVVFSFLSFQNGTESSDATPFLCAQCYNRHTTPEPTALCVAFATQLFIPLCASFYIHVSHPPTPKQRPDAVPSDSGGRGAGGRDAGGL